MVLRKSSRQRTQGRGGPTAGGLDETGKNQVWLQEVARGRLGDWAGARSRGPYRSQGEVGFCSGKNAHDLCTEVFKSKLWQSLLSAVWQAGKQSRSVLKTYKKEDLKPQGLFLKGFKGYPRKLRDKVAHTLLHHPVCREEALCFPDDTSPGSHLTCPGARELRVGPCYVHPCNTTS